MKATHIRQLSKQEQLSYYKRIKATLIAWEALTVENIINAMDCKINDIDGLLEA